MTKNIRTEILIHATPEKVWAALANVAEYPSWNPFIKSIQGKIATGNRIRVTIQPADSNTMTFSPQVLEVAPLKKIRWKGKVLLEGLFDGEHLFELTDRGNGTTTFVQSEKFSGLFVGLFNTEKTEEGFRAMNQRLKEICEGKLG